MASFHPQLAWLWTEGTSKTNTTQTADSVDPSFIFQLFVEINPTWRKQIISNLLSEAPYKESINHSYFSKVTSQSHRFLANCSNCYWSWPGRQNSPLACIPGSSWDSYRPLESLRSSLMKEILSNWPQLPWSLSQYHKDQSGVFWIFLVKLSSLSGYENVCNGSENQSTEDSKTWKASWKFPTIWGWDLHTWQKVLYILSIARCVRPEEEDLVRVLGLQFEGWANVVLQVRATDGGVRAVGIVTPGRDLASPSWVEDGPGVPHQHHHLQVVERLQQTLRLSDPQPDGLDETDWMPQTNLSQIVGTEAEWLPGLEVLTRSPEPGVVTGEEEGVLSVGHVIQVSLVLSTEPALKHSLHTSSVSGLGLPQTNWTQSPPLTGQWTCSSRRSSSGGARSSRRRPAAGWRALPGRMSRSSRTWRSRHVGLRWLGSSRLSCQWCSQLRSPPSKKTLSANYFLFFSSLSWNMSERVPGVGECPGWI